VSIGSIKAKLAMGFGLILVLLSVVAWEGHIGLNKASDGFTEYREMARDSNLAGRLHANLLMTRMGAVKYIRDGTDESLRQFKERRDAFQGFLNDAQREIQNPERAALVDHADEQFTKYSKAFNNIVTLQDKRNRLVNDILIESGIQSERNLSKIMESAKNDADVEAGYLAGETLKHLLLGRLYAQKFLTDNEQSAVARVNKEFQEVNEHLQELDDALQNPTRRALLVKVQNLTGEYKTTFDSIVSTITERNALSTGVLDTVGPIIADDIEKVKLSIIAVQDEIGPRLQASNESAVATIDIVSLIAVTVGIAVAFILAFTISKRLGKTVRYAEEITSGKFDTELDITGKDELATLAAAMRRIPETLTDMADSFKQTSNDIRTGHLSNRADASRFQGSFGDIVRSSNDIADAFSGYLENVPLPIMAIDSKYTITYLNKAALEVAGLTKDNAYGGTKCYDVFKTSECQTENCACNKAMRTLEKSSSETDAHPQGLDLEISYTGIPTFDDKGNLAGAFEVIVDQTKVKQTQKRILSAVERASDVSERIASASEELAAQVEQVSQGSQVQSERTAETASAMEQMNSTVLEVARNASEAAQNADQARQRASSGSEVVEKSVGAIGSVKNSADELTENMNGLSKQAESIGDVMTVISDIADQTNLLALNAAIEAARAGDAGRGFAVVADEVRKLAEKTMSATDEVGKSISAIQEAAKRNMGSMDRAVKAIDEATELSQESGKALMEIVDFSQTSADQVQSIATASEEQSATSEQISSAVEGINQITTETADGMRQSAKAIQELAVMSGELKEVITSLNQS
jgi:methyl-accepting chemotaxis protein